MIIIKSDLQNDFEDEYIENLIVPNSNNLVKTNPRDFLNLDKSIIEKSKIIIIYSPSSKEIFNEINSLLNSISYKYYLVHLSDENLEGPYDHYDKAEAVFRSYFNPKLNQKNCFTIPLGFQNGFLSNNNKLNFDRKYIWYFCGQAYSTRKNMIENLESITPNYIHKINSFMSFDALSANELSDIYSNSYFAPCPFGYISPDTFRIMETLESGCIPIVKKLYMIDYFKIIFGDHPFVVVNKWKNIGKVISDYQSNPEELHNKQKEVWEWYSKFKQSLSSDIEIIIKDKNSKLESVQFNYQKQKIYNFFRRFIFFYWFKLRRKSWFIKIQKFIYKSKKTIKKVTNN